MQSVLQIYSLNLLCSSPHIHLRVIDRPPSSECFQSSRCRCLMEANILGVRRKRVNPQSSNPREAFFQVFLVVHSLPHSVLSALHPQHTHNIHTQKEGEERRYMQKTTSSKFSFPLDEYICSFQNLSAFVLYSYIKDLFPWFLNLISFRLTAAPQSLKSSFSQPHQFFIMTAHASQLMFLMSHVLWETGSSQSHHTPKPHSFQPSVHPSSHLSH